MFSLLYIEVTRLSLLTVIYGLWVWTKGIYNDLFNITECGSNFDRSLLKLLGSILMSLTKFQIL